MSRIPVVAGSPVVVSASAADQKTIVSQSGTISYSNTDGSGTLSSSPVTVANDTTLTVASGRGYAFVADVFGVPDTITEASLPDSVASRTDTAFDIRSEIDPTGATIGTDELQDILDTYAGVRPVRASMGTFALDGRVTIPDDTHLIFDAGAKFLAQGLDATSGTALLYAAGTESAKVTLDANVAAGASSVALPTGQVATLGFVVGDLMRIECTTVVSGAAVRSYEQRMVTGISTDTLSLDVELEFPYTTAATAKVWRAQPVRGLRIDGMAWECGDELDPTSDGNYALRLDTCLGARINAPRLTRMVGGILIADSYDTHITDPQIAWLPNVAEIGGDPQSAGAPYSYGVTALGSTTFLEVDAMVARATRHAFTTLARTYDAAEWGGPQHVNVNGAVVACGAASFAGLDTHEDGSRHIAFNNCKVFGGGANASGFQVRSKNVEINGCKSYRAGLRAVNITSNAEDVEINGGRFDGAASNGMSLSGTDIRVIGAGVKDSGGVGIAAGATGVDVVVENCSLKNNTGYGVQDLGATRLIVRGGEIPYSAAQTGAVLNLAATGVIQGTDCRGFGSGGFSGITSGAKLVDVLTDTGVVNNVPLVFAVSTGDSRDVILYRSGTDVLRTDSVLRTTEYVQIDAQRHDTGTAAPGSGTYALGDIVWNSQPASAEPAGWICTVAGTPGTWAAFGTIA